MARVPRSALSDGIFHAYSRAVAGASIFLDDADRSRFLALVRLCEQRHGWLCHAFTLLSTHYHLVLETTRQDLSAGLHRLNGRYARDFNKRHGRFGHVFAERFQARVIESEEYLYDACAYVALNPVRAGLCDAAEEWPWTYCRYGP
jgi:REP-associated tyrosine transposase